MEYMHICPLPGQASNGGCHRVGRVVVRAFVLAPPVNSDFREDCHQEAQLFIEALGDRLARVPPHARCAYCETAVRRRVRRAIAAESRHRANSVPLDDAVLDAAAAGDDDGSGAVPGLPLRDIMEREDVARAFRALQPQEQRVLDLLYRFSLSGTEVARALGTSPEAVRQTHHRALDHLRRILRPPSDRGGG